MSIIKWILFFVLLPFLYIHLFVIATLPFLTLAFFVIVHLLFYGDNILLTLVLAFSLAFTFAPFVMYIYGEIFGFFKFIDKLKLNFWIKLLIIFLISIILFLIMFYSDKLFDGVKFDFLEMNCLFSFTTLSLVQSFFIYKLLNHINKTHPLPFQNLDYYFSIECYKKLFKKIKNKLIK